MAYYKMHHKDRDRERLGVNKKTVIVLTAGIMSKSWGVFFLVLPFFVKSCYCIVLTRHYFLKGREDVCLTVHA